MTVALHNDAHPIYLSARSLTRPFAVSRIVLCSPSIFPSAKPLIPLARLPRSPKCLSAMYDRSLGIAAAALPASSAIEASSRLISNPEYRLAVTWHFRLRRRTDRLLQGKTAMVLRDYPPRRIRADITAFIGVSDSIPLRLPNLNETA